MQFKSVGIKFQFGETGSFTVQILACKSECASQCTSDTMEWMTFSCREGGGRGEFRKIKVFFAIGHSPLLLSRPSHLEISF